MSPTPSPEALDAGQLAYAAYQIGLEEIVIGRMSKVKGTEGEITLVGKGTEDGNEIFSRLRVEKGVIVETTYRKRESSYEKVFRQWTTLAERSKVSVQEFWTGSPYYPLRSNREFDETTIYNGWKRILLENPLA